VRTTHAAEQGRFNIQEIIRLAQARRPDVRSAREQTAAARASAETPLYQLAPTVSASAQVRTVVDPLPPDTAHDESAQLTLTWVLFDGGARYGDRRTRKAQANSQALDEHQLLRSIATDVNAALAGLRAARQVYAISQNAVENAKKNMEETSILYQQGLGRAIELTEANSTRYDAEVTLETSELGMKRAYLQLRQALGLEAIGPELGGAPSPRQTP
jgi:outer membrane protein TolC